MDDLKDNPLSISKIEVKKLFGIFDYDIIVSDMSQLLILYGDNGTGKTTIVEMIFYLLSTKDRSGYKSKIASIKFSSFKILFKNGLEIGARRRGKLIGSYTYYISKNKKSVKSVFLPTTEDRSVQLPPGSKSDIALNDLFQYLKRLNITTFYLSDDRAMFNSLTSSLNEENSYEYYERNFQLKAKKDKKNDTENHIERLVKWISDKVISGSLAGEKNTQAIFSDIIKNYITLSEGEVPIDAKDKLLKELEAIENMIPPYVELGLVEKFDSRTIRNSIKRAKTEEQIKFLGTIISPFLESLAAKLNALETIEKAVSLFILTINNYFTNKTISFNLQIGFTLKQENGDDIDFDWLSSGEKQLVLLIINTITSADDATIFIIDEPEISLNIKWQRNLIKTLLEFSRGKKIQFLLSSHSFEILSGYRDNVSQLINNNVAN